MNLLTIPVRCLRTRWLRTLTLFAVFTLGVSSIVALHEVSKVVGDSFERKLTSFGANILVAPHRETLNVSYGGFSLGDVLLDTGRMPLTGTLERIGSIPLKANLAAVAPKLLATGRATPLVGGWAPPAPATDAHAAMGHTNMAQAADGHASPEEPRPASPPDSHPNTPHPARPGSQPEAQHGSGHPRTGIRDAAPMDAKTHAQGTQPLAYAPEESPYEAPVPIAVVGVDWVQERALKGFWNVFGRFPHGPGEVVLGHAAAMRLGIGPGGTIRLGDRELPVTGVLDATGSDDDGVAFTDIATVQQATARHDQASFIEVAALCSGCPIDDIVAQLAQAAPGLDIRALRHVVEQRMYSVRFAQDLALTVSVVILLTACSMVVMSMLSSVNERKREIGILRSVGFSRAHVFAVFTVEALMVGVASGAVGYASGHVLAGRIIDALHLGDGAAPPFDPVWLVLTTAGIALLSTLAAAFPAWKASRVEPAEALVAL